MKRFLPVCLLAALSMSFFSCAALIGGNHVESIIIVTPKSEQFTYVGCTDDEKIKIVPDAKNAKGFSVSTGKVHFSYTASGCGTVDENGVFTPTSAGTCTITVSDNNGHSVQSNKITVFSGDTTAPYTYWGKEYKGLISEEGSDFTRWTMDHTMEYPTHTSVTADGFITIKAKAKPGFDAIYVECSKKIGIDENNDPLWKFGGYWIRKGEINERIWLRLGAGEYRVFVGAIEHLSCNKYVENGVEKDGAFLWDWPGFYGCAITVINTDNTRGADSPDARAIFPSYISPSDNVRIMNVAHEITYGLTSDRDKIKAIHDYLCNEYYYDHDSLEEGKRKKQDAVSVLENGTCVCEGYANITNALARAVGICSRYQGSGIMNHAWNHVWIDNKWQFIDVTWDDPDWDDKPRYNYFLIGPNGVLGDHFGDETDDSRNAIKF